MTVRCFWKRLKRQDSLGMRLPSSWPTLQMASLKSGARLPQGLVVLMGSPTSPSLIVIKCLGHRIRLFSWTSLRRHYRDQTDIVLL